jgi:hypothetical protein
MSATTSFMAFHFFPIEAAFETEMVGFAGVVGVVLEGDIIEGLESWDTGEKGISLSNSLKSSISHLGDSLGGF